LISQKDGSLDASLSQSSAPHPVFCGQNSIDAQNSFSYTPSIKKEVVINIGELKDFIISGYSEILLRKTIAPLDRYKKRII
jgi:hypothetical protein